MNPILEQVVVGALQVNCWIVGCPETRDAVVIDPGADVERINAVLHACRLTPVMIVDTHGHIDHVGGNAALSEAFGGLPVALHPADEFLLGWDAFGLADRLGARPSPKPSVALGDGYRWSLGSLSFEVLHTPGHSPGSCCLRTGSWLFAGDTVFAGSIGRTDLPGGDQEAILRSIAGKIVPLPPETLIFPGHGPDTVLQDELEDNPFFPDR